MKNDDHQSHDPLQNALAALRSAPIPPGPTQELLASTLDALRQVNPKLTTHGGAFRERKPKMTRTTRNFMIAAASLLLVLFGSLALNRTSSRDAFAAVIDQMNEASSVSYTETQWDDKGSETKAQIYRQGDSVRMEIPGNQIQIRNATLGRGLTLEVPLNVAIQIVDEKIKVVDEKTNSGGPVEDLIQLVIKLEEGNADYLGGEQHDGNTCDVYSTTRRRLLPEDRADGRDESMKVWIDRATRLPARIRCEAFLDGRQVHVLELGDFQWNKLLEPALFSLTPPAGFEVRTQADGFTDEQVPKKKD